MNGLGWPWAGTVLQQITYHQWGSCQFWGKHSSWDSLVVNYRMMMEQFNSLMNIFTCFCCLNMSWRKTRTVFLIACISYSKQVFSFAKSHMTQWMNMELERRQKCIDYGSLCIETLGRHMKTFARFCQALIIFHILSQEWSSHKARTYKVLCLMTKWFDICIIGTWSNASSKLSKENWRWSL